MNTLNKIVTQQIVEIPISHAITPKGRAGQTVQPDQEADKGKYRNSLMQHNQSQAWKMQRERKIGGLGMEMLYLQGIGKKPALQAKDLKPGMTIIWNYGYRSIVKEVELSKTGKTINLTTISESNNQEYQRKHSAMSLIAVAGI